MGISKDKLGYVRISWWGELPDVKLELLSIKELQSICSKSLNEDETYRINNFTRLKKVELLEKMNAIYDTLEFFLYC